MFLVFSRHKMIQITAFSILRCKITIFYGIDSLIIVKTARCSKKCIVLFLLRVLFLLEIVLYACKEVDTLCHVTCIAEIILVKQIVRLNVCVELLVEFVAYVCVQVVHVLYALCA